MKKHKTEVCEDMKTRKRREQFEHKKCELFRKEIGSFGQKIDQQGVRPMQD